MTTWYEARIVRIEDEAPLTRRFWMEVQGVDSFEFRAGQFVTMDLPISERRLKRWRSYSIASAPDGTNILEFCIVKLEGGAGTSYLFEEATIGTVIKFKGPDGAFYLPNTIEKDLVFICTGTGVAPFRSMIWDIQQRQLAHHKLHLIFGTRYESGVLYADEWQQLSQNMPSFSYDIALSKESKAGFYEGYLHQIYSSQYATPRPDVAFYLCGWSNMIDEAVAKLLLELGYDRSQIHYELYG